MIHFLAIYSILEMSFIFLLQHIKYNQAGNKKISPSKSQKLKTFKTMKSMFNICMHCTVISIFYVPPGHDQKIVVNFEEF